MKIEDEIKQDRFRSDFQKAILNLTFTAGWISIRQEEFFKPFKITGPQFNILRILRGQDGKSLSGAEIKSRMLERNSDISRLLDRLARKELITRSQCPSDKRITEIRITKSGLALLKKIDGHIDEAEQKFIHLTKSEAMELSRLLDKARG